MGALIQYYSLAAKRRKKQELLRQAQEASKDKSLGEAQTLVEVITPITPNMTFPLGSQAPAQAAQTPAPQTPPPLPKQDKVEAANDVIGTWLVTMGSDSVKIPIKSAYTLVVGKKRESIRAGEERNERPALALLASWGILKRYSSFRKKMPKNMAYTLKKGDHIELDSALKELEDSFLKMGAAYYMQVGSEGRIHLYSNKIPPYWDSFIHELEGKGLVPSGSVRLRRPSVLVISVGGKNISLKFNDVAALVGNNSVTHFDILRRYITTGKREAHHDDGGGHTPHHPTIFDDSTKLAAADLHWMTINLVNEIRSYLEASWENGSYTKEGEIGLRNQIEEYLADKTLEIKNTAEAIAKKKSRSEAFKFIQQQGALVTKVRSVISEWNDLFHSEKTQGWSGPKFSIPVTESVLTEAQLDKLLMEVTFRKLMDLTQRNGNYKIGGLVKIGNSWVTDPRVKGRVQNSMFVVTKPPTWKQDTDGLTRIDYNFKSRPDRSTTGLRQKGYIKFIPPGFLKRMIQKIKGLIKKQQPKEGPDSDVQCFCTCPDFKYRWHKVLADKGASHTPTGQGGEATNQQPNITNPTKSLSLCKHLAAMAGYLATTQRDVTDYVSNKRKNTVPVAPNVAPKVVSGASVDSST